MTRKPRLGKKRELLWVRSGCVSDVDDRASMARGWAEGMGVTILAASADEVTCAWEIAERHRQPYGLVHGGVHCGVIETIASIGAALAASPRGQRVVGLENSTSFLRAVRSGRLTGTARPVTRGRTTQVWEAWIRDEQGNLVAQGRVRLLCLDADRPLG